jgi:hypothetical protein
VPLLGVKRIGWRCHPKNLKKNLNLKVWIAPKYGQPFNLCRQMKRAQGLGPAPEWSALMRPIPSLSGADRRHPRLRHHRRRAG